MPARERDDADDDDTTTHARRARRDDPGVYQAQPGERVRVAREARRTRFTFVRYDSDLGGEYAVVIGGMPGHRIERCVTVDRVLPYQPRHRRRVSNVRSQVEIVEDEESRG